MATIYDVAKLANVSISTVSNYLNNKYIGPEKRKAIQKVIEQLKYVPNQSAIRLKTKKSDLVAVIIPSIDERIYSETLMGVTLPLEKAGYKTVLYITDDLDIKEEKAISDCLTSDYAGVVLCTCNPDNTPLFLKLLKRTVTVFIIHKPSKLYGFNYIGFNDRQTLFNITNYFLSQSHEDLCLLTGPLGYPNEKECIKGYQSAFKANGMDCTETKIINLPSSREATFKVIIKNLYDGYIPKLIITTSVQTANTVIEAALLRNIKLDSDINIISLGEDSWYNFESIHHLTTTNRPAKKLGMFAAETLIKNIGSPKSFEYITKNFRDDFLYAKLKKIDVNLKRFTSISIKPVYAKTLKLLLTKNDNISDTIRYTIPEFCNLAHVNVEIVTKPHTGIYDELMHVKNTQSNDYDIFAIDVPWLNYFSQNRCLLDISNYFEKTNLLTAFDENTLLRFGEYNGNLYGIPYLNAAQLLYYRKDVFSDDAIKNLFYQKYNKKLSPPKDWHEYNVISKFFTKKHNPNSPFEFGTCIARSFHEALMGELYPRIWTYGGDILDRQGRVCVYSDENISAFKNMVESLQYSDPKLCDISALERTKRFAQGEFAMVLSYHHHACVLADRATSTVFDNVGYDYIPGKTPILAGWTMGVNQYSKNKDEAITFLNWLLNAQSSISYTVLGGNSARENTYYNPDLLKLYPWFELVPQSSILSKPRNTPLIDNETIIPEVQVEHILADVIFIHLRTGEPIERLLLKAQENMKNLFINNGYIEPRLV